MSVDPGFQVYVEDTDATGLVYHSRYLNFCERARTRSLSKHNTHALADCHASGLYFVVSKINAHYIKPLKLNDHFEVTTSIIKKSRSYVDLAQSIICQDEIYFSASIRLAMIDQHGKARRISNELIAPLESP